MRRALFLALAIALLVPAAAPAGTPVSLAPLLAASVWLNGRAQAADLRGKVVIVDVFTVDCGNCQNVTPNLRALHGNERGRVAIVGIHTPETPLEHERAHVVAMLRDLGVTWPVAIDDDAHLWNAYGVDAWPTQFIFDKRGRLRKTVVGDSQDDAVDATVRALLAES